MHQHNILALTHTFFVCFLLLNWGCGYTSLFTDVASGFWQNMLYCYAPLSCATPFSTFFMVEIVILHWCHTWQWEWAADRRWRSRTIFLTACWYYEFAVMWNWILSQSTSLWAYAPALAIKARVMQAGRIWWSVVSDATGSPHMSTLKQTSTVSVTDISSHNWFFCSYLRRLETEFTVSTNHGVRHYVSWDSLSAGGLYACAIAQSTTSDPLDW